MNMNFHTDRISSSITDTLVRNPCAVGSPFQLKSQNVQCSTLEQSVCPETHYCHVGADMETSVCCPRHGKRCFLHLRSQKRCFERQLVCIQFNWLCQLLTVFSGDPCTMPISIGTGKSQLQRWAFNSLTRSCQTFVYTGMGGNENNFITEADCIGTCQGM